MESRIYRFEIRICCFPRYNLSANVTQTNPRCHGSTRVVECTHGFEAVQGASPEVTESVRALVVTSFVSRHRCSSFDLLTGQIWLSNSLCHFIWCD